MKKKIMAILRWGAVLLFLLLSIWCAISIIGLIWLANASPAADAEHYKTWINVHASLMLVFFLLFVLLLIINIRTALRKRKEAKAV